MLVKILTTIVADKRFNFHIVVDVSPSIIFVKMIYVRSPFDSHFCMNVCGRVRIEYSR